ncbi:hypothetical protein GQ600_26706 [Phytophthora cactorum]|nr:hypothetical protein GQ600_26706 [Phytophthora cactorum]
MVSDNTGRSNWTKEKSPLSEFVLLPRNRPQPRRPVEVLLFSQAETENLPRPTRTQTCTKLFDEQLEVLREKAESKPRLMPNVRAMEEKHAIQTKRWLHTKERIRSLASEIQQLRRVLQT